MKSLLNLKILLKLNAECLSILEDMTSKSTFLKVPLKVLLNLEEFLDILGEMSNIRTKYSCEDDTLKLKGALLTSGT